MPRLREARRRGMKVARWALPLLWATDRRNCVLVAVCSLLGAAIAPVSVLVTAKIVGSVQDQLGSEESTASGIWPWTIAAGAVVLFGAATMLLRKYTQARLNDSVSLRVRKLVLGRASGVGLVELEDKEMQNELSLVSREPGGALVRSVTELFNLIASSIRVVGLAAIMLVIEPLGTLAALVAAAPLVITGSLVSLARHRLRRQTAETNRWARYYSRQLTNYQYAPSVRILGLADWMIDQAAKRIRKLQAANRRIDRIELVGRIATSALAVMLLMYAVQRAATQAASGAVEVGRFVAFWVAAWRLSRDSMSLANSFGNASKAWLEADHLKRFLERTEEQRLAGGGLPEQLRGEIVLEDVRFRYSRSSTDVLHSVSLRVEPGETIAIVGHNGAGKTTLAKLLAGLYQPTSGDLRYDGASVSDIDPDQLHRRTAMVMQRPLRMEATAGENIALGDRLRLWGNDEELEKLAAETGLDAMISRLPEGYDTKLGRMFGDHDLSGGQWQKLAIARALACDPAIVILDEPTSGLDIYAEADLIEAMQNLARGRTTILISHRFSTVAIADRIVVLENGRIVEQGSHEELLAAEGIYADMHSGQPRRAA